MSLPPFPSQALAKLVLGYLAEEQLMTAYDEFLQASPYLDALQDEYDFMFMTSLKSILSEYRALKIFLGTCKPISVRKIISQCSSLLDIVKLLVSCVDLSMLSHKASNVSSEKHYLSTNSSIGKNVQCESCASLKLVNCVCNSKLRTHPLYNHASYEESPPHRSVEATPLADLPGNHVACRRKQIKVLDKDARASLSSSLGAGDTDGYSGQLHAAGSVNSTVKERDKESRQKLAEFDDVLRSVVDGSMAGVGAGAGLASFREFAAGVGGDGQNSNVPDSSTSIQPPITKEYYKDNVNSPLLLQVSRSEGMEPQPCRETVPKHTKHRAADQKVKIISEVVTKAGERVATTNATSTPGVAGGAGVARGAGVAGGAALMHMKTIVINGAPAYKHNSVVTTHAYTKDEIMAMPTLILVPAPGPPKIPTDAPSEPLPARPPGGCARSLEPLVIEVSPPPPSAAPAPSAARPADPARIASLPKDVVAPGVANTPQGPPPLRKSSSTPRRSTHVRVLDFATPRRVLHGGPPEPCLGAPPPLPPPEALLSNSPNVSFLDTPTPDNALVSSGTVTTAAASGAAESTAVCDTEPRADISETDIKQFKRSNWDADLRALIANDSLATASSTTKRKTMKTITKKRAETSDRRREKKRSSPRVKTSKRRRRAVEEEEGGPAGSGAGSDARVRPTINIISRGDPPPAVPPAAPAPLAADDCGDTPEGERLSLQNVMGARLNISELLETPYKQALYDLQMGTPRFLPELPGEPLSDVKISSIPTPRFLDTPRQTHAAPSPWASRPTDYSSGGSYYKPDDVEYLPAPEWSRVAAEEVPSDASAGAKDRDKTGRPQRRCTRNVSYGPPAAATAAAATATAHDSRNKEIKTQSRDKTKPNKAEPKKRSSGKSRKSPVVKQKPSIKIKPRQTPTKQTPRRYKKRKNESPGYSSPHKHKRGKEVDPAVPAAAPAPTKSRRKSSTPRKLHCAKSFASERTSPDTSGEAERRAAPDGLAPDSESEHIALRWSDDGSQDTRPGPAPAGGPADGEDISQIQAYIRNTDGDTPAPAAPPGDARRGSGRGFDAETAKLIERELLDTPPQNSCSDSADDKLPPSPTRVATSAAAELPGAAPGAAADVTAQRPAAPDTAQDARAALDSDDEEEDFSVHECNEESDNYIRMSHDDAAPRAHRPAVRLKDNYLVDISIDDRLHVKLRATALALSSLAGEAAEGCDTHETESAVGSISDMDRLYTPLKESFKAQVYEIFDSTLTSIDTPLKDHFSHRTDNETAVPDAAMDEETHKASPEAKKRKRSSGSDESTSDNKKTKYLLTKASIQNMDIETVLTKLHGP